jgi:hypothetical protein
MTAEEAAAAAAAAAYPVDHVSRHTVKETHENGKPQAQKQTRLKFGYKMSVFGALKQRCDAASLQQRHLTRYKN